LMMQQIQVEAESLGRGSRVSSESLAVLLALARKSFTIGELGATLGMNPSEFGHLVDRLCKKRFVDTAYESDGDRAIQTLHLTDKGEQALLREMEQMCELPER